MYLKVSEDKKYFPKDCSLKCPSYSSYNICGDTIVRCSNLKRESNLSDHFKKDCPRNSNKRIDL